MKWKAIFFIIILFGFISRFFLIIQLPVWYDERDSIDYIQMPLSVLFSGTVNIAHPPGYSFFLSLWSHSVHSLSLVWLRFSTLGLFFMNCLLFYKLGSRYLNSKYGIMVLLAYCLSGYSVIFDWQIRPYTGLVALMLTSLYLLTFPTKKIVPIYFFIINCIGLLFDYGFLWYVGSLFIFLLSAFLKFRLKHIHGEKKVYMFSLSLSLAFFMFIWFSYSKVKVGIEEISWIRSYTSPEFFVPYFLGLAHQQLLVEVNMVLIFFLGCIVLIRRRQRYCYPVIILSGISLYMAFLMNSFFPILHVRNLQIVGIGVIFIYAFAFYWLAEKKKYVPFIFTLCIYGLNLLFIIRTHFLEPGKLLLRFLPF